MYRGKVPGSVVLQDGTVFSGFGFGAQGSVTGEVVFNTGMTGYQEIVTDPSYYGQLIAFTYPMIGNYGAADHLRESAKAHSRAIIVREIKNTAWNASCPEAWVDWLTERGIVGVGGIDTRALTRRIREYGAMPAIVAAGDGLDLDRLAQEVAAVPSMAGQDLVGPVTCLEPYVWPASDPGREPRFHVVALDYGMKWNILRNLDSVGCRVTVVPAYWTAAQVLELRPDGVFLSNGPGDPAAVGYAVETLRGLLGKAPIFGICLGHQLLALAVGFSTYKLKFGHRGINHPVRNYVTGRIEITSQNHGFAVELPPRVTDLLGESSAAKTKIAMLDRADLVLDSAYGKVEITHLNLNDGTVEGVRLAELPAFSVQYHPEAGPGPHDGHYLFREFVKLMEKGL